MTIWDQFESEIRSAAYTSSLVKFVNNLCAHMDANIGRNEEERALAEALMNALDDRAALKMLRDETTFLVLMVRTDNDKRREEWEAKSQGEETE